MYLCVYAYMDIYVYEKNVIEFFIVDIVQVIGGELRWVYVYTFVLSMYRCMHIYIYIYI
jgi:hypothetical protein